MQQPPQPDWAILGAGALTMAGLFALSRMARPPPPPPKPPHEWPLHATEAEMARLDHAYAHPGHYRFILLPDGLSTLLAVLHAPLESGLAHKIAPGFHNSIPTHRFRRDAKTVRALLNPALPDKDLFVFTVLQDSRSGRHQLWLRCRFDPAIAHAAPILQPDGSGIHSTLNVAAPGVGWLHVWSDDDAADARLMRALAPAAPQISL